jgi:hypothetical protein
MEYKVHYPNGQTIVEYSRYNDLYLPGLDKVFWKTFGDTHYFVVTEMSEEEVWLEEISDEEYMCIIPKGISKYFVNFDFVNKGEQ